MGGTDSGLAFGTFSESKRDGTGDPRSKFEIRLTRFGDFVMAVLAELNTSSKVVLDAQKLLNKARRQSRVKEDGAFDNAMLVAIKDFQEDSGLKSTGILDTALMAILKKAAQIDVPKWEIKLGSKIYLFTEGEYRRLVERTAKELEPGMRQLKWAVEDARMLWDHHNDLKNDQYIVSWCIELYAGADLPKQGLLKSAEKAVAEAEKALKGRDLRKFPHLFKSAAKKTDAARLAIKKYVKKVQEGGDSIVTGLTFIKGGSFLIVGVIAGPVAASYGAGAIAAGVIAGAGTAATETLATEVGKGVAGTSKGTLSAVKNVLLDGVIGGSIGALVKGKAAEKILKSLVPSVAKRMPKALADRLSKKGLEKFVSNYFKNHGTSILEGILKDTLTMCKSTSSPVTFRSFVDMLVKNVVTAGVFSRFDKAANLKASSALKAMSSKTRDALVKGFGSKPSNKELLDLIEKLIGESAKHGGGQAYDSVYGKLKGGESESKITEMLVKELFNKKMMKRAQELSKAKKR